MNKDLLELIPLKDTDFPVVKEIYDYYILNSTATFHTEKISISELKEVIPVNHPKYKSFLIRYDGAVCGYCYFSYYKKRQAYDRSSEVTMYLKNEFTGKGIGRTILERLEKIAVENNIFVLIGILSGENDQSIHLFENCGYEKCAHFRQIGEKFGRLLDVVAYHAVVIP
jgi:phosphinothricin acetyltransferase